MLHNSSNMGTCGLPDMYTLCPRPSGVHIRQTTRAHVTTIKYSIAASLCAVAIAGLPIVI